MQSTRRLIDNAIMRGARLIAIDSIAKSRNKAELHYWRNPTGHQNFYLIAALFALGVESTPAASKHRSETKIWMPRQRL